MCQLYLLHAKHNHKGSTYEYVLHISAEFNLLLFTFTIVNKHFLTKQQEIMLKKVVIYTNCAIKEIQGPEFLRQTCAGGVYMIWRWTKLLI